MTIPVGEVELADLRLFDTWYSLHLQDRPDDWVAWVLEQVEEQTGETLAEAVRVDLSVQLSAMEQGLDDAVRSEDGAYVGAACWIPRPQDGLVVGVLLIEVLHQDDGPLPTPAEFATYLQESWPAPVLRRDVETVDLPAGTAVVRRETVRDEGDHVLAHEFWTVFAPGATTAMEFDFGTQMLERAEELEAEAADIMKTLVLEVGREAGQ